MKIRTIITCLLCINYMYADEIQNELLTCKQQHEKINPVINDDGMLWYRTAASKKAIFNQINAQVQVALKNVNKRESSLSSTNGVVSSLDNLILDNSDYTYYKEIGCISSEMKFSDFIKKYELSTNPSMGSLTCTLQSQGLKIIIITNRSPTNEMDETELKNITVKNLNDANVCYDSILFATSNNDTNKNLRINAVTTGDYENTITTKKLPPINIVAYLGSDIQDFPNFKQDSAMLLNDDSLQFNNFGSSYFIYPNPTTGSWEANYWK